MTETQAPPRRAGYIGEDELESWEERLRCGGGEGGNEIALRLLCEVRRLREAIWPGLPKWEPTPEEPQQDFYEAVAESLRVMEERANRYGNLLHELSNNDAYIAGKYGHKILKVLNGD